MDVNAYDLTDTFCSVTRNFIFKSCFLLSEYGRICHLWSVKYLKICQYHTYTTRRLLDTGRNASVGNFDKLFPWRTLQTRMMKKKPIWGVEIINRAVYTGIKKPEFFSHSVFLLEVARQLPINTAKNPNKKTHLRSVVFWNSAGFSLVFSQCKRLLPSHQYYSGLWSRGTWPSAESPAARDVLRTTYGQR